MPDTVMGAEDTKTSSPPSGRSHRTSRNTCICAGHYSVEIAEMGREIMRGRRKGVCYGAELRVEEEFG